MDIDTLIQISREQRAYEEWEREEKNRILRMSDAAKKMEAWRGFTRMKITGEVLTGNVF